MKICTFCGSTNEDSSKKCVNCGASEFEYKCLNCGKQFKEGLYCPSCGIKVGTKAKHCPNCNTDYFTPVCPTCGYKKITKNKAKKSSYKSTESTMQNNKKWLWILGWLLVFPIPATILIRRNNKLSKKVKIVLASLVWIFYLFIGIAGTNENEDDLQTTEITETVTEIDQYPEINNEKILEFVSAFNDGSELKFDDFHHMNIRTKYSCNFNGNYVILMDIKPSFEIEIHGKTKEELKNDELFLSNSKYIIQRICPTLTTEELETVMEQLPEVGSVKLTDSLKVEYHEATDTGFTRPRIITIYIADFS